MEKSYSVLITAFGRWCGVTVKPFHPRIEVNFVERLLISNPTTGKFSPDDGQYFAVQ